MFVFYIYIFWISNFGPKRYRSVAHFKPIILI